MGQCSLLWKHSMKHSLMKQHSQNAPFFIHRWLDAPGRWHKLEMALGIIFKHVAIGFARSATLFFFVCPSWPLFHDVPWLLQLPYIFLAFSLPLGLCVLLSTQCRCLEVHPSKCLLQKSFLSTSAPANATGANDWIFGQSAEAQVANVWAKRRPI